MSPDRPRIAALDGLRGLAALLVLVGHSTSFVELSPFGVEIFFALSGFLIGGILMDSVGEPGWAARFYLRRTARIWPLYFLVVGLIALTEPPERAGYSHWQLWCFLANVGPDGPDRMASSTLWSIAVEEHWYLLFPWIVASVKRSRLAPVLPGIAVLSIATRAGFVIFGNPHGYTATFTRLDGLCFGALAAWVTRYRREWIPWAAPVALFAGGWRLSLLPVIDPWSLPGLYWALVPQTMGSLATAALILCLVDPAKQRDRLPALLSFRPLRYLGEVSYGTYLFHGLLVEVLHDRLGLQAGLGFFLLLTTTAVALATLSFRLLEAPILRAARSYQGARASGALET